MKANLTSLEIHYLVQELQFLVGSRVDNIYNPLKEELFLQLHTSDIGKQILRITSGKFLYLASIREAVEEPSGFCMFLRKHLGNSRLKDIKQLGSERIVEFVFEKEEEKRLIIELFGKGNIILCDKEGSILSALVYHRWKDREIRANIKYAYPKMQYNLFDLKLSELMELFNRSKENLGRCLATELGLGGKYSEEVCLLGDVDKGINPPKLKEEGIKKIFKIVGELVNSKSKPLIVYGGKEVIDIVPFELKIYKDFEKKEFQKYNESFDYYFLNEFKKEKPITQQEKEIERLKRMIEKQQQTIKELECGEIEERKKADLIYQNYELINKILEELRKAIEKYDWKEVENRLKGHKLIKAFSSKDKTIAIEI